MIWPAPISAYIGINGSGKTLSAVAVGLTDYRKNGRPLVTNVLGISEDHVPFSEVEELPDLLNRVGTCTVVLDEAGALFSSRNGARDKAFGETVQMLRKYDARLLWTAPAYARADKILREVTLMAVLCSGVFKIHSRGMVWASTRLSFQRAFDVSRIDNSAQAMNRNAKGKGYGLIRTATWQNCFDSFAIAGKELVEARELARAEGA